MAGLFSMIAGLLALSPLAKGQISGDLRLVSTSGSTGGSSGRLEVYYSGQWGTVCMDLFGRSDGMVACKQLGFDKYVVTYGRAESLGFNRGSSTQRIWLDNLRCRGTESRLTSCNHSGFGWHNCDHSDDVGLECQPITNGSLRLQDGGISYGRLEIYYHGQWGTVCDDYFSRYDADVACRQLGYYKGYCWGPVRAFRIREASYYVRTWLDDLNCTSNDTSLIDCSHRGVGVENCDHSDDVAVVCAYRSSCSGLTTSYSTNGGGNDDDNSSVTIGSGTGGSFTVFLLVCYCIACCCCCCYFSNKGSSSSSPSTRRYSPPPSYTPKQYSPSPSPEYTPRPTKQPEPQLVVAKLTYVRTVTVASEDAYPLEN